MCAILAASLGLAHAQASDLLKRAKLDEAGEAVSSEDLRKGPVLDNQTMLLTSFRTFAAKELRNILFDGHSLIDTEDTLIEIPIEVIKAIGPAAVLFLWEEFQKIADRRAADSGRRRPFRTADELAEHQARAEELAGLYAANLRIPFFRVRSGDEEECCATVTRLLARA